jgi:7-carboxy-7-deazaguanine synthase
MGGIRNAQFRGRRGVSWVVELLLHPDSSPGRTASRAPADDRLLVAEIFGPTFQGEGPSVGRLAAFVRLSRCQLACAWCDTPYTWDRTRHDLRAESRKMTQADVWHAVKAMDTRLVVITGGEPLLQQDRLVWLADMCRATGRLVEIETNGAVVPSQAIARANRRFNVSLKLANSGMPARRRLRPAAIRALAATGRSVWKFVVTGPADLEEIASLQRRYGLDPVWVMPEGTTSDQVLRRLRDLADPVLARGWNLTPRLHTLLWENARGR